MPHGRTKCLTAALFGVLLWRSGLAAEKPEAGSAMPRGYSIPTIDLADQTDRQVIVDREDGQYLGHVSSILLEDNKTIIAVYPKGHGRGAIVMKKSSDGGLTWSERLPTPASWATRRSTRTAPGAAAATAAASNGMRRQRA